jgi:hypothetical protein
LKDDLKTQKERMNRIETNSDRNVTATACLALAIFLLCRKARYIKVNPKDGTFEIKNSFTNPEKMDAF